MQVENKYFYFSKNETDVDNYPEGWEEGWYFRAVIETKTEQITIEDLNNNIIALDFKDLYSFTNILNKIQTELHISLVGAPRA